MFEILLTCAPILKKKMNTFGKVKLNFESFTAVSAEINQIIDKIKVTKSLSNTEHVLEGFSKTHPSLFEHYFRRGELEMGYLRNIECSRKLNLIFSSFLSVYRNFDVSAVLLGSWFLFRRRSFIDFWILLDSFANTSGNNSGKCEEHYQINEKWSYICVKV